MRLLSGGTLAQSYVEHNAFSWAWIYEVMLEETALVSRPFRVTSHDEQITIAGDTYRPFPIIHEAIEGDAQGSLPSFTLYMSNVTREITRYLEVTKGMSGNRVTIGLFNLAAATADDLVLFDYTIAGCSASDEMVSVRLQSPSFSFVVPQEIYVRGRCRWRYKSFQCGYRGSMPECTKALFGVNGCVAHGEDEHASGRPRLHPRRFGGFPGLQRFAV